MVCPVKQDSPKNGDLTGVFQAKTKIHFPPLFRSRSGLSFEIGYVDSNSILFKRLHKMLSFTFRYAPVWRRAIAMLIDIAALVLVDTLLLQPFIDFLGLRQTVFASSHTPLSVSIVRTYGVWFFMSILIAWLYFAKQESSGAQATIGKRFMGLIVFSKTEERLTFRQASVRFWSKFLSLGTLTIGFFSAFWDRKSRALHDHIAHSLVVCEKPEAFAPIPMDELEKEKPTQTSAGFVGGSS